MKRNIFLAILAIALHTASTQHSPTLDLTPDEEMETLILPISPKPENKNSPQNSSKFNFNHSALVIIPSFQSPLTSSLNVASSLKHLIYSFQITAYHGNLSFPEFRELHTKSPYKLIEGILWADSEEDSFFGKPIGGKGFTPITNLQKRNLMVLISPSFTSRNFIDVTILNTENSNSSFGKMDNCSFEMNVEDNFLTTKGPIEYVGKCFLKKFFRVEDDLIINKLRTWNHKKEKEEINFIERLTKIVNDGLIGYNWPLINIPKPPRTPKDPKPPRTPAPPRTPKDPKPPKPPRSPMPPKTPRSPMPPKTPRPPIPPRIPNPPKTPEFPEDRFVPIGFFGPYKLNPSSWNKNTSSNKYNNFNNYNNRRNYYDHNKRDSNWNVRYNKNYHNDLSGNEYNSNNGNNRRKYYSKH